MPDDAVPASGRGAVHSTEAWRTGTSQVWATHADRLETMIEPVLVPLFDAAALRPGEVVLDVGCGRGATTREAARLIGPDGRVVAIDVAGNLIEAAAAAPRTAGAAPIEWVVDDAQRADLGVDRFDTVISRFGVMFFDDAVEAFANLARSTRRGGRLAVVTWRPRDASPFQSAWFDAVVGALGGAGHDVTTAAPTDGPFAFGVDEHVIDTLRSAGWHEVALRTHTLRLQYGGAGTTPEEALDLAMAMPMVRDLVEPHGPGALDLAAEALMGVFRVHHEPDGVAFSAAVAVVTARRY
jgi:SAM-dependent methyltransferase